MLKYYVNDVEVTKDEFMSDLETAVTNYVEDNYDDILDEIYKPYKIGNMTYYASQVLSECDPVAYRCGRNDEVSYELSNYQSEFEDEATEEIDSVWFETKEE